MSLTKTLVKKWSWKMGFEIRRIAEPRMGYREVTRLFYFKRLFDLIKDVEGDVVECGVGRGGSFLYLAFLMKDEMKGRKLWGFDSFKGFPMPSDHDKSVRRPQKGDWDWTSVNWVEGLLVNAGLDRGFVRSQVTLVKGFFKESLPKYRGSSIAFLHIDVDLYDSYLTVLHELFPKVAPGGVILFDEYMETTDLLKFPGAQKAIDEYLGPMTTLISRDKITGKYYLIKNGSKELLVSRDGYLK